MTGKDRELINENENENDDHVKNANYHLRFWDLINSTKSSDHVISTQPLFNDENALDYLWRAKEGQKNLGPESNNLVPQIVWEMEASNSSYTSSLKVIY